MIAVTKCQERGCRHWRGVYPLGKKSGVEADERPRCTAFPKGIPDEIAYGDNKHTDEFEGDHGIQFENGDWLADMLADRKKAKEADE